MNLGKVGVIFNGGGFTGAFSVGFAKAIWKNGIKPEYIQGVSVGALSGAKLVESGIEELEKVWLELEQRGAKSIFNWSDAVWNIPRKKSSIFNNHGIVELLSKADFAKIINSPTELQIVTTNESKDWEQEIFSNREEKYRDNPTSFKLPVLASTAVQGGLPPVMIDNEQHSDGMIFSLEAAAKAGCDTIFLLLNDQAGTKQDRWDQRLSMSRHMFYDRNVEYELKDFLRNHKDFDVAETSNLNLEDKNLPPLIKRMIRAARSLRSVASSAVQGEDINFVPHRIFPLHTRTPIETLSLFSLSNGDVKAAIEQGYDQASVLLDKILK